MRDTDTRYEIPEDMPRFEGFQQLAGRILTLTGVMICVLSILWVAALLVAWVAGGAR